MLIESVKAVLKIKVGSSEAKALAEALAADDEERRCSTVKTRLEGDAVIVEVTCNCSSPLPRVKGLVDDVFRVLAPLESSERSLSDKRRG